MEVNDERIQKAVKKAMTGDQSAFNFLLNSHWNQVYGFQIKRVKNEYEAEEITIETFAKAFDKLETYLPQYAFSTWLITISKNVHIDKVRKKNSALQLDTTKEEAERIKRIPDDALSAEDTLINEQNLAQLLRYIKELKPHYQDVINLRFFQEKSYKEISDIMQESLTNVKVKLLRAKNLLASIIQKNEGHV